MPNRRARRLVGGRRRRAGAPKSAWSRIGLWVLLFGFIGLAAPIHAQQQPTTPPDVSKLSIEELMNVEVDTVYGASKFEQKITSAPSFVTIINADEIQGYGYRTLADLLQSVVGFYVTNDRNYTYIGVRGFSPGNYNNRVLLLIDGHRLNDTVYGEALVGTDFPLDIDLIRRVEVIRGPGSALYGTNAFFAVINVITKRGRDVKGAEVSAEAGSLGTYKGRATFGDQPNHGPELLVSGTIYHSLGNESLFFPEFNTPATNNGLAIDADGDRSYSVFGSVQYRDFSVQGLYGSRTKTIPTASFGTLFNDPHTRTTDALGYFDVKYEHQFQKWNVMGRVAYDRMNYYGNYIYDYTGSGVPPFTANQDFSTGERVDLTLDVSRTFWDKHRVTMGTETQFKLKQNQSNYDQAPYVPYLNDHRSTIVPAVYVEDEFSIRRNLTLSAGIRWDYYSGFGSTVNPRLGLIYSPTERTTFKALYGTAFRAPNAFELYYAAPPDEAANHLLQPERIRTIELVFEQYFARNVHFAISGFNNDLQGLISQELDTTTGLLSYANLQNVRSTGVDFALEGKWRNGLQVGISDTFQKSRDQDSGAMLSNSPEHLFKVRALVPVVPRRLFASMEAQYVSSTLTNSRTHVGGFFLANATVSSPELIHGLSFSGTVHNLFDKRYANPVGEELPESSIVQDGRTVSFKLTYRFKE